MVKGVWRDTGPTGVLARVRADAGAVTRAYRRARRSSLVFGAPTELRRCQPCQPE